MTLRQKQVDRHGYDGDGVGNGNDDDNDNVERNVQYCLDQKIDHPNATCCYMSSGDGAGFPIDGC